MVFLATQLREHYSKPHASLTPQCSEGETTTCVSQLADTINFSLFSVQILNSDTLAKLLNLVKIEQNY